MKQKHSFLVTVGIPSLFLVFSVLVLSVLALLTLGNSRNSLNTAKLSLEQTENYYAACTRATETTAQVQNSVNQFAQEAADETEYFSRIKQFADTKDSLTWDPAGHTLSFSESISDTQQLSVVLKLFYPTEKNSSTLNIQKWNTKLIHSWTPDNKQNVFKGGN